MDAAGHVPVKRVVGREDLGPDFIQLLSPLEKRRAHRHSRFLHLFRPGDHAPIIVREHRHRFVSERRVEDALAGGVEVLAVDKSEDAVHNRGRNWESGSGGETLRPRI